MTNKEVLFNKIKLITRMLILTIFMLIIVQGILLIEIEKDRDINDVEEIIIK